MKTTLDSEPERTVTITISGPGGGTYVIPRSLFTKVEMHEYEEVYQSLFTGSVQRFIKEPFTLTLTPLSDPHRSSVYFIRNGEDD